MSKKDNEMALQVVSHDNVPQSLADKSKTAYEMILERMSSCGLSFKQAPLELKEDIEIVMAAVSHAGRPQHASEELKKDHWIVQKAASRHRMAIQHAGEELRDDCKILMAAAFQNWIALRCAPRSSSKVCPRNGDRQPLTMPTVKPLLTVNV